MDGSASRTDSVVPEILRPSTWQMPAGERVALEGLLTSVRPRIAVEIGSAMGGSLARTAHYSGHVHSVDLYPPAPEVAALENVTLHTGDSHVLLPAVLAELAGRGENVDFAMVDGDHSVEGAFRDVMDLLESDAVGRCVMIVHDSANPDVRAGLDAVPFERFGKVRSVDLDFVGGQLYREPDHGSRLWNGFACVIVDDRAAPLPEPHGPTRCLPTGEALRLVHDHHDGERRSMIEGIAADPGGDRRD